MKNKTFTPYPHQRTASTAIGRAHLNADWSNPATELRHKIIMPCGSGKTFTAYLIIKNLEENHVLIMVPNLLLRDQIMDQYFPLLNKQYKFMCIGTGQEAEEKEAYKGFGYRVHTKEIAEFYKKHKNSKTITICTYQSTNALIEAQKDSGIIFDIGIIDEAHRTAIGFVSEFSKVLFNEYVNIRHRVFMTATERVYVGKTDELFDMSSANHYGETAFTYSIKQGIEDGVLNNYKVATMFSNRQEVFDFINNNPEIKAISEELSDKDCTQLVSSLMCVIKAVREKKCRKIISYHSNVRKAKLFSLLINTFDDDIDSYHVNGVDQTLADKHEQLNKFKQSAKPAVLTNAQALVEGIDIPPVDAVIFVDKKDSHISIIQAIGRCLRINKGKGISYVFLPILIKSDKDINKESAEFLMLYRVLMAIAIADQRLYSTFVNRGSSSSNYDVCEYLMDDNADFKAKLMDALAQTELRVVKKLNVFLPFEKAREVARGLGCKMKKEYEKLASEGKLPVNLPRSAHHVYKNYGWKGWADYLDCFIRTKRNPDKIYSYAKCVKWARKNMLPKGINTGKKWRGMVKELPEFIPLRPDEYYKEEWVDWPTFYGIAPSVYDSSKSERKLSYEEACEYVKRELVPIGIDTHTKYIANKERIPKFLPSNPHRHYWGKYSSATFFGDDRAPRQFMPYEDAKRWVQENLVKKHGITDCKLWESYVRNKIKNVPQLPKNIPKSPQPAYERRGGWKGWGDWFGTGIVASYNRTFWTYEDAKKWVKENLVPIGINNSNKWNYEYIKGLIKDAPVLPKQIPNYPPSVYKNKGWKGWGEFFGTGRVKHGKTKESEKPNIEKKEIDIETALFRASDWPSQLSEEEKKKLPFDKAKKIALKRIFQSIDGYDAFI